VANLHTSSKWLGRASSEFFKNILQIGFVTSYLNEAPSIFSFSVWSADALLAPFQIDNHLANVLRDFADFLLDLARNILYHFTK
jgi:hypothetical protein